MGESSLSRRDRRLTEQYHLGCVGLTSTPDGNWICPRCIEKGKNKVQKPAKKAPSKPKARK